MNPTTDEADSQQNLAKTENGAAALKSTLSATVDFFGLGGALRYREGSEVTSFFSKAFEEKTLWLHSKPSSTSGMSGEGRGSGRPSALAITGLQRNIQKLP